MSVEESALFSDGVRDREAELDLLVSLVPRKLHEYPPIGIGHEHDHRGRRVLKLAMLELHMLGRMPYVGRP